MEIFGWIAEHKFIFVGSIALIIILLLLRLGAHANWRAQDNFENDVDYEFENFDYSEFDDGVEFQKVEVIKLPSPKDVLDPKFYMKLAEYLLSKGVSRRKIPNVLADIYFDSKYEFVDENGNKIDIDDEFVDRGLGGEESFRWLSDFYRCKDRPWKQKPHPKVIERLIVIGGAMKAENSMDKLN